MSSLFFNTAELMRGLALTFFVCSFAHAAEPTGVRSWKSTAGSDIEARAKSIDGGVVTLETPSGREIKVPTEKFVPEDQAVLEKHFGQAGEKKDPSSGQPTTLAHKQGEVVGPIEARGSHYFFYLPKSLKTGRKSPLLFFTNSGGGTPDQLTALIEGSEICGWILAISVESKNGMEAPESIAHCRNCVSHIKATLPVDADRVYFSGISGGSREAFENSVAMDSAGVLAIVAGAQPGQIKRRKHYFFISGATDFNRYGTAKSFSEAKGFSAFRFNALGHAVGPDWLVTEGIVWLESKWHQKAKKSDDARADFETAALDWVEKLKTSEPWRAAWWAAHLIECGLIHPVAQTRAAALTKKLGAHADAVGYAKAITDLEGFAADTLSGGPIYSPDCMNHTNSGIRKKAEALASRYAAVPWVKEICAAVGNPTDQL